MSGREQGEGKKVDEDDEDQGGGRMENSYAKTRPVG
jgi:hypothetical protein